MQQLENSKMADLHKNLIIILIINGLNFTIKRQRLIRLY